jgi:hypothetical protein
MNDLRIVPVDFPKACGFIVDWDRNHTAPAGSRFCLGVADNNSVLHAAAIVGRPFARHLDDGFTLEVSRAATDGTRDADSMLYRSAERAAEALGYRRLVTYLQQCGAGAGTKGSLRTLWEAP